MKEFNFICGNGFVGRPFVEMELKLSPLETADAFRLNAAQGWLELGDAASANDELDQISSDARTHPAVLFIRCQIYFKAKNWDGAAEISETLTHLLPDFSEPWINLAYATRRKSGGSVAQAKEILLKIESKFPRQYIFSFNLACYCSQLGQFEETEQWLKKAMAIDEKTIRRMVAEDDDLKPFLASIKGDLWRKNNLQ